MNKEVYVLATNEKIKAASKQLYYDRKLFLTLCLLACFKPPKETAQYIKQHFQQESYSEILLKPRQLCSIALKEVF